MLIVGIGGTLSPSSSSERALHSALAVARELGARTESFTSDRMRLLPMYDPTTRHRGKAARELVEAVREADGVIISSAAYHGGPSGLLKNALDYIEDLADDPVPYLSHLPVGLISVASGWQGAVNTLAAMRSVVHSLRGWPTPYGCTINTASVGGGDLENCNLRALTLVAEEVVSAAGLKLRRQPTSAGGTLAAATG